MYIQRQKRSNQGCCFCPNSIYVFFFFHLDMLDLFCSSKRQDNAKSSEPGSYKAKDNNENTIICGALSIEMIDNNVCVYWKSSSTRNYWPIPPWSRVSLPRLALLAIGPGVPFPHECINDLRPRCTYCHLTPASLVIL